MTPKPGVKTPGFFCGLGVLSATLRKGLPPDGETQDLPPGKKTQLFTFLFRCVMILNNNRVV